MNQENTNTLDGGTYEIIRGRLQAQKNDLLKRLEKLDAERKKVFGSIETKLIANNRIQTENNCIPRDIISVGDISIFGYNVHFGLRTEIKLDDVFSVYQYDGKEFKNLPADIITNDIFLDDFVNLYKYYRNTIFHRFVIIGNYLYMVFQLSESQTDIKTFKWLIKENILTYIDNRSDHEYKFPAQHDFDWTAVTRDKHKYGKHPHVSILDKVFVETLGGDLTIKIEDNTNEGKGIYSEPVLNPDQTLDDGSYRYADLGNLIALEIKPFQEDARYFIYNHKIKQVQKIDSIKNAAIQLPDNHGLIFSNGYYLQSGEYKIFDTSLEQIKFQERIASPNGEDFMYVFFEGANGQYVLMQYNLISQSVKTPIICNGYTILKNGELCYFITEEEQTKNHVIQIWQTPFTHGTTAPSQHKDALIYKIGNKDVVRAMADSRSVITLLNKEDNYSGLYNDLTKFTQQILDSYYWINEAETFELNVPLIEIKSTANAAIDEYEKVVQLRANAQKSTQEIQTKANKIFSDIKSASFNTINDFVQFLAALRSLRGELIGLKEVRYIDQDFITKLEHDIVLQTEKISQQCVHFLLDDKALEPYHFQVEEKKKAIDVFTKVIDGKQLETEVTQITTDLEMLIDIVSNLKIEDTTHSTKIIDNISLIFSTINQVKAGIRNKINALGSSEARADFAAQIKLVAQSTVNYLDMAGTPEKADELLNKIAVQLEDLEARFGSYDEFIEVIIEKREEVQAAFEARKNSLMEARNKRAVALESAADRILKGVVKKSLGLKSNDEINGYFASDMMISKLRDLVSELQQLDESAKAEGIETALKSAKEDAVRKLKDKQELFEDGDNIIKLGKHKFAVNKQLLDLTIVAKDEQLFYHLTGTGFYQQITNEKLVRLKKYWSQDLVSENNLVYRSSYLAYKIFSIYTPAVLHGMADETLMHLVKEEAGKNYTEGYTKGVHDEDAFKILKTFIIKDHDLGLLRYAPADRAFAQFFWYSLPAEKQQLWNKKIKASGEVLVIFPASNQHQYVIQELTQNIQAFTEKHIFFRQYISDPGLLATYIFEELKNDDGFCSSQKANKLLEKFEAILTEKNALLKFKKNVTNAGNITEKIQLVFHWVSSYFNELNDLENHDYTWEVVALELFKDASVQNIISEYPVQVIDGLLGTHSSIQEGSFYFNYHTFVKLLSHFYTVEVPAYEQFRAERHQLTQQFKEQLRLNEFEPKVLTSFVRNKLIDQVYLPLFGENLAKQLGTTGDNKRTDRSGMLLLVSPPGYGKTTLMEYLANRLGLVFMKINGPSIGHDIISVDPANAANAAAREELKKLNLALEMGNNVMLYIDDIQHCSPEFLQKFISLADGTRKMDGVYNGRPKTYDMKGKKFCLVMAGNPYTESGEQFKIPDMLANRSDTYNLGDIIGNTAGLFKLSLIENSLTSNAVLRELSGKSFDDLYQCIKRVETGTSDGLDLKGNYSRQELETYTSTIEKVITVRNTLLKVNEAYINSAATDDAYRTEPPFKLQGSYRDMNKLVSKIVPVMNAQELQTLLLSHYENESQTLTNAAEANILKYKEMTGTLTEKEAARWDDIKTTFVKNNKLKGFGNQNNMAQVIAQMMEFTNQVAGIKDVLQKGITN